MSDEKLQRRFAKACEDAKRHADADHETLRYLYAHYKQATAGDCKVSAPAIWDITGNAKHRAWLETKGMSAEKAMCNYVNKVRELGKP